MPKSPVAFIHMPREKLPQRPPLVRQQDWDFIGEPLADHLPATTKQASRCMDCAVPFCQSSYGCPVENLIPDWNALVTQGRWREALESLQLTNNFPEFTGFLCPAPCESACVLNRENAPVTIRDIELQIIEQGFAAGWVVPQVPQILRQERVAIVGSGPAGLAAAQQLRRMGLHVTVFERAAKPGGLLRYGIPDFKMPKSILDRRIAQMMEEGVEFKCGVSVGEDVTLSELRASFDAVCLAVGAEQPRDLNIPGRELGGVIQAMPYLSQQNQVLGGEIASTKINAAGKTVAVIGGGDTGSDCIATALRQGAKQVYEFSLIEQPKATRGDSNPWPQWPLVYKKSYAHEEGCERVWGVAATHLEGASGWVKRIHTTSSTAMGAVANTAAGQASLDVDLVILAIGFTGIAQPFLAKHPELKTNAQGTLVLDAQRMTSVPGVFAAGDAVRGASLIVWAIAEGRKVATSIAAFLAL
ncbi:MAG: glutamate synthase subunit beta [Proteobacteria bacterium]|nr:glutamate synthase subunit beta [Pseudomonadota bacterium]